MEAFMNGDIWYQLWLLFIGTLVLIVIEMIIIFIKEIFYAREQKRVEKLWQN
jgi:hypothetical protein